MRVPDFALIERNRLSGLNLYLKVCKESKRGTQNDDVTPAHLRRIKDYIDVLVAQ